jgi:hypothetical protein
MADRPSISNQGAADIEDSIKQETGQLSKARKEPSGKPRFIKSCCNAIRFHQRFISIFFKFRSDDNRVLTALSFGF